MKAAILRAFGRESQAAPWDNEESIREELFSVEEGTGIGLVMSKRVVELMGGVIGVESTVRGGSVFWIELVVAAAQLSHQNYQGQRVHGYAGRGTEICENGIRPRS